MTETNPPQDSSKKSFWRQHAFGALVAAACLSPLLTNGGCSPTVLPQQQPVDQCPAGQSLCNGLCVDVSSNATSCGMCGNVCAAGSTCASGACQCLAGQTQCTSGCVNLAQDAMNCGVCGTVCGADAPYCSAGVCSATCGANLTACGTSCADVQTSETDCGTCGNVCGNGTECTAGTCVCPVGATCNTGEPPQGTGGATGVGGAGTGVGGGGVGAGGDVVTGAGGSDVVGAGGAIVTASGGSEGSGDPLGGYHVHGDWAGFAFTFVEEAKISTITPGSFDDMVDQDGPYHVSGSVPTSEDYTNIAAFGVNVNQPKVEDAPVGTVASAGDGIMVDVVINSGESKLRVQLEDGTDPADPDSANHRWCAGISGTGVHPLPWGEFTTKCWCALDSTDDSCADNTVFDGRAIAKVIIYVPDEGPDGDAVNFDFTINDIGPTNITSRGTGEIVASCGNNSVTWGDTISDPFGQVNAGNYSFQNNAWNLVNGSQTAQLLTGAGFKLTTQSCNTTTDAPCSFPSVYVGTDADGTKTSGFTAKPISQINSIPTCLGWSSGGTPASDEYNVSYDVWFNSNAGANNAEKFLMVWFRDPPSFQPGGMTPIATSVIGDQSWSIWFGPNANNQDVVSFVAPNKRADGQAYSFNLKDFIDEAVDRGYLQPSLNLIAVMGGMEIWGGAQGASITGFRAEVQ